MTVIRPTCVCAAREEPYPGFVSSRDAFCGTLFAYGKGLLQRFPFCRGHILDIVPVDVVVNSILLSALSFHNSSRKFVIHVGCSARSFLPLYTLFSGAHDTFRSAKPFPGSVLPCVPADRLLKKEDGSVESRDEFLGECRRNALLAERVEKQHISAFSYFLENSWLFQDDSLRLLQTASPPEVSEVLPTNMTDFEDEFPNYIQYFAKGVLRMITTDTQNRKYI